MSRPLTVVVGGMIGAVPGQGGATWAVLQYLLGLTRLGHTVYFVETLDRGAIRPAGAPLRGSENAHYLGKVMGELGLGETWAMTPRGTRKTAGLPHNTLADVGKRASVLLDISGTLAEEELFSTVPIRVYLDVDPAFTQLWDAQGIDMRLEGHTHYVTVGQSIGSAECLVPTGGRHWTTSWPPVVLDHWPVSSMTTYDAFTTVANWRAYGSIDHEGVHYGQKVHSLRRFMSLPTQTQERFALALGIGAEEASDLAALRENRWQLIDPEQVADTPAAYRGFVRESKAEFGIAKDGYVRSRSGWFSDRSVCYLAAGRPVLAQDTGFSKHLPTGAGLLAFETTEDVLEGVEAISSRYDQHAAAARSLAEEIFDSDRVLSRLLDEVGATS